MPCLRIKLPNQEDEVIHLLAGERITIGRRADNTIQIRDGTVSAHHAELIATNGYYRLHDLGSTNLTCVEGQPVHDFHLHGACKLLFGSIEAEYLPETPKSGGEAKAEFVPTRAEMEYLRRENFELQSKLWALQRQVDILGSAPLMTRETTQPGVQSDVHQKVVAERDQLREQVAALQQDVENSRCDIVAIMRDRDAMRQAWETVKAELAESRPGFAAGARPSAPAPAASVMSSAPQISSAPPAVTSPDVHRGLAQLLGQAPGLIEKLRASINQLASRPGDDAARGAALSQAEALAASAASIAGHPIERLVSAMGLYFRDLAQRLGAIDSAGLRPLLQALEILPALLDPRALKRAKELRPPQILALDDDADLLSTLVASLEMADLGIAGCSTAAAALAALRGRSFDLILLDISMSDVNGLDVCTEIRALPGYRQTPIVFLTSSDTTENRARSSLNGGTDFLVKPFNILELTLRAETWIYKYQFELM